MKVLQSVLKWLEDGVLYSDPVGVRAFLCGRCDRTHLQFHTSSGSDILLDLSAAEAEELAKMLINPEPIMPGERLE